MNGAGAGGRSVSYTHLDVYKRQTKDRMALIESQFMCSYNFKDTGKDINQPCPTLLTKDRLSLVSPFFMNQYSGGGQVRCV